MSTVITTQFASFKMVGGVMNWFCTRGFRAPITFYAYLEHFSNFVQKFSLLSVLIPSAVDFVANFIVLLCNTIFFVTLSSDTRKGDNFSSRLRDFNTPLAIPFCAFLAIVWRCEKASCHLPKLVWRLRRTF